MCEQYMSKLHQSIGCSEDESADEVDLNDQKPNSDVIFATSIHWWNIFIKTKTKWLYKRTVRFIGPSRLQLRRRGEVGEEFIWVVLD